METIESRREVEIDPQPLSSTRHSSLIESILEQRLVADLGAYLARCGIALDVLHGAVDHAGHDVVLEAGGVLRHIQLKAMHAAGKRADVTVNQALATKSSGCVIWTLWDPASYATTGYRWLGDLPGQPLPNIGSIVARHTKGSSIGYKAQRPAHRVVRASAFTSVPTISALARHLFGIPDPDDALTAMLRQKQRDWQGMARGELVRARCVDTSSGIAHMIDGYDLLAQLGYRDFDAWLQKHEVSAARTGSWPGALAELWIALFLMHRRWKFAGGHMTAAQIDTHDRLLVQIRRGLNQLLCH